MIIHFERSGGFTGLSLQATINTQELRPEEQEQVKALVEQADFFATELGSFTTQGADRFNYTLIIEDGERNRSVTLPEGALPPDWEPLVEYINALARQQRRQG